MEYINDLIKDKEVIIKDYSNDSELRQLKKFKQYFDELKSQNLHVANVEEGTIKPFETYYQQAIQSMKAPPTDVTIAIDIDNVINDLCETWCEWLRKHHYNVGVKANDITDWNVCKFYPMLTEEQVFEPLTIPEFWAYVKPKDGAVEYIKKLMEYGFQVYLCTATDYRQVKMKQEMFMQKYFSYIGWERVIITEHKEMINTDIFIDDKPENLKGTNTKLKLLMEAPHNKNYNESTIGAYRITNWKQIYDLLVSLY